MTGSALAVLIGGLLSLGWGGGHDGATSVVSAPLPVQVPGTDWPPLAVPFVAQGPLLCGGAAAAMVERFWGARGVHGEDYAHLVTEEEGGIRTSELVSAMRERGYEARVSTGQPAPALGALAEGVPPILLLESDATSLHYVVLVGLDGEDAWIHDPNFGPERRLEREELLDRWAASGYWALLAVPSGEPRGAAGGGLPAPESGGSPAGDAARSMVRDTAASAAIASAMDRLRAGDLEGARVSARTLVRGGGPPATTARRIMAAAWFLEGERTRALAEWNALGEPVIDLVVISGLEATRHATAAARMSLGHGDVLEPTALALARRRLAQLPSVEGSRIEYRPLPNGTVEVQAAVFERPRTPGIRAIVDEGIRSALHERAALEAGPWLGAGDRWRVEGSWEGAQRFFAGSLSAPAPPLPGVATVGVEWRRERFAVPPPEGEASAAAAVSEQRLRGFLELHEWVHPNLRLGVGLGVESWDGGLPDGGEPGGADARLFSAGIGARSATADDRSWLTVRGDGWTGAGTSFGRIRVQAGTTIPQGTRREWALRAGGEAASHASPRMIWPGAGAGRVRDPLLRAHDLVENELIAGPAFGRQLLHATVEHRLFRALGPLRAGWALFVDAAHVGSREGGAGDRRFLDIGTGVFLDVGESHVAVDLAYGSDGWKLSGRVGAAP